MWWLLLSLVLGIEVINYNPVATPAAVVTSGNARFTVLTKQLIRIEYSSTGKWEDRSTLAVVNRQLPVPQFSTSSSGGVLTITTQSITLSYTIGQPFSASTLSAKGIDPNSKFTSWQYGQTDGGNLLGTIRSLDGLGVVSLNCTENANIIINGESLHCEWGLISRLGWHTVDETGAPVLTNGWWDGYSIDTVDIYLFAHGLDYKQALYDYQLIGGKIVMVPRYVTGIMWSRWFDINDYDTKKIVNDYESRNLPLDVYILDMNWHTKNDWTGYTFDSTLYPYPAQTLGWVHGKGLANAANLHDADGVNSWEKMYPQTAQAVGIDPSSKTPVPFSMVNQTIAYALEDIVLYDVEQQGMDFWWIDWQQGGTQGGCDGNKKNPTIWLNYLRCTDYVRRGENKRGAVLARFGGLGNHRYQVGFSGDVNGLTWQNLAFQPYFSLTASNVGYGFWSHDLVGPSGDHEMHTRWLQWGAFSGIFRTHDRGMSSGPCADTNPPVCPIVEVWKVPNNYFEANREAMLARARLTPYIYTAFREAFDTGVSLIRPMYYYWADYNEAYLASPDGSYAQFMFGPDLLVAPVVNPSTDDSGLAKKTLWLPPGVWIEDGTNALLNAGAQGTTLSKLFELREIPMYARAGAIIPSIPIRSGDTLGNAARQYRYLIFTLYPGATSGSTAVYEDDGMTVNYLTGAYAWTNAAYTRTSTSLTFTIGTQGTYAELPPSRGYELRIINSLPVKSATVNGVAVTYSATGGANTWFFEGNEMTVVIQTSSLSITTNLTIQVNTDVINDTQLSGIKGAVRHAIWAKASFDEDETEPCSTTGNPCVSKLTQLASFGNLLSVQAGVDLNGFYSSLSLFPALFQAAVQEVANMAPLAPSALAQLYDSDRQDSCLCASQDCLNANSYYTYMRTEGYQPLPNDPNRIPLNLYWSPSVTDNWVDTRTETPPGYQNGNFGDGYVLSKSVAGTAALQLWYSSARSDHLTVATADGIQYALSNGYQLLNSTIGYVYTSKQLLTFTTQARYDYGSGLLANALN